MNNLEKFSPDENEADKTKESIEKEPEPEKAAIFVRHPSVRWLDMLFEKAVKKGEDMETYVPIDQEGLKMANLLSDYLKNNLFGILKDSKGNPRKYQIFTSPLKRAKSEAEIVLKRLKLASLENPSIPIPENNELIESELFLEVPNPYTKEETMEIVEKAKQKGVNANELLYLEHPEKISEALEKIRPQAEQSLEFLKNTSTPVSIVFAHRAIIALHLWLVEQKQKGKKDLVIKAEDVPSFVEFARKIPFTSLSEIDLEGGEFVVKKIGEVPHLAEQPELRKGVF